MNNRLKVSQSACERCKCLLTLRTLAWSLCHACWTRNLMRKTLRSLRWSLLSRKKFTAAQAVIAYGHVKRSKAANQAGDRGRGSHQ